jgi:hypothetical protein
MVYEVIVTEAFRDWYEELTEPEQDRVGFVVDLLQEAGPALAHPYSSGINGSKFSHMRELRVQFKGRPYRVLYAFDPVQRALLLIGGDKTGNTNWYDKAIPQADALYSEHLRELKSKRAKVKRGSA